VEGYGFDLIGRKAGWYSVSTEELCILTDALPGLV